MDFSFSSYINLLEKIQAAGYRAIPFKDITNFAQGENLAIIRHDVDLDLSKAREMAILERKKGICSTYFVLLSSSYYNLMHKENYRAMMDILSMGHEVGLHFDVTNYAEKSVEDNLEELVLHEIDLMERILGRGVKSLSWHIPKKSLLGKRLDFLENRGIQNAYDPQFFNFFRYYSDSMMRWREDILSNLNVADNPNIQVLTHPIWYEDVSGEDSVQLLFKNRRKKSMEVDQYLETIVPGFYAKVAKDYNNPVE